MAQPRQFGNRPGRETVGRRIETSGLRATGHHMRLTRCFIASALTPGTEIALPESAATHLVRVLRLREGDECALFNGNGHDYPARITLAGKREVRARVLSKQPVGNESPLRIVLLQGIARGEKMDLILQKATELGVAAVVPVNSERSEVKLDAERAAKRVEHWRSVVVSACEQSGRAVLPTVAAPQALATAAIDIDAALKLTLDPEGEHVLTTLAAPSPLSVCIAIGPEGGWSPHDREILKSAGFNGLRLGPRILRTETAGLAAIAALQARLGDLSP
jgi:16S rRNA (uracil1498-N3)-methyltransferase